MKSIQCREVIDRNCKYIAYGINSDEAVEKMLKHWKEYHNEKRELEREKEKLYYMIHLHV